MIDRRFIGHSSPPYTLEVEEVKTQGDALVALSRTRAQSYAGLTRATNDGR